NFYLQFLDEFDLRNVNLVGLSLGGWIAAELAVRDSHRLRSLTLVAPAGVEAPGVLGIDTFMLNDTDRIRAMFSDPVVAEQLTSRLVTPDRDDEMLNNRRATALLSWSPRDHDPGLRHWLYRIKVPTCIVWGSDDRIYPPELGETWRDLIPSASLVLVPE